MAYIGTGYLTQPAATTELWNMYDLESILFSYCIKNKMYSLFEVVDGRWCLPPLLRRRIHVVIMNMRTRCFMTSLAEELARRDMDFAPLNRKYTELPPELTNS
jgi:hypothetical protein